MGIYESKMRKRLSWIAIENAEQAEWLRAYISQKGWCSNLSTVGWPQKYVISFLDEAMKWDESAETRERCRNLKAAWQTWKKRHKNKQTPKFSEGSYNICIAARNQLEKLSKKNNANFSKVIEQLLLNAQEIEHLQRQLTRVLKEKEYGINIDSGFLASFFADDALAAKAQLVAQQLENKNYYDRKETAEKLTKARVSIREKSAELRKVKSKMKNLQEETDALKAESQHFQDLAQKAKKELEQYLAE